MDKGKRLSSLDALRGFDMMFIMGVASVIFYTASLFPGGSESWIASQMEHVEWNGWHHHDTIFVTFLFIAGISWPFSYAKRVERGDSRVSVYLKIITRGLVLVALGIVYNGFFHFQFETMRFHSVLGRIGLAWMFAALIYVTFGKTARWILSVVFLLGYWGLCRITAPDMPGADPLSQEGCLVGYIDRCLFPGHLIFGNFDPEGLLSTLPAIVTALLGMFTGDWVRRRDVDGGRKTLVMLGAAALMFGLGYLWNVWFPINKKLWTSTFVLVMAGFSLASFAVFYWIIDVKGWRKWSFPFRVIGMNSIVIYMAQAMFSFGDIVHFFLGGTMALCEEPVANLIYWSAYVVVCWLFLYFLYRKNIFIRI